jgi:16S rRNA processing protein RimM
MLTDQDDEYIAIGRFGKVHGIKADIVVHYFSSPLENMIAYKHWFIKPKNLFIPVIYTKSKLNDKLLVKIEGYPTREAVATLTNLMIYVPKNDLPHLPDDEYYCHDLIGLTVIDMKGEALGKVSQLFPVGNYDVFEVLEGKTTHLIPYCDPYIVKIDMANKVMQVEWDSDF